MQPGAGTSGADAACSGYALVLSFERKMSTPNSPEVYVPSKIYAPDGTDVSLAPRPKHRYWLHLLLLALTFFTTLIVGARLERNFLVGLPPFTLENNEIFLHSTGHSRVITCCSDFPSRSR